MFYISRLETQWLADAVGLFWEQTLIHRDDVLTAATGMCLETNTVEKKAMIEETEFL